MTEKEQYKLIYDQVAESIIEEESSLHRNSGINVLPHGLPGTQGKRITEMVSGRYSCKLFDTYHLYNAWT